MRRVFLSAIPRLVGAFFLYSGAFKILFPGEAEMGLETIGLPGGIAAVAAAAATVAEVYLGTLMVLGLELRYCVACSIVMLLVFTIYLFYLSTLAHPPTCGCVGLTGIFKSNKQAAIFGLLRNCLLLWALRAAYSSLSNGRKPQRPALAEVVV